MAGQISGQITVTTAGTEVQGPDLHVAGEVLFFAHPDNTDLVWIGNDGAGAVSSSTGFPLKAGANQAVRKVTNLKEMWFDADVSGEKICYLLLN